MNRVAVFGGAGFVGTNLAYKFIGEGRQVYNFDNLSRLGTLLNLVDLLKESLYSFVQCNYANKDEAEQALFSVAVDTIFICASTPTITETSESDLLSLLETLISWIDRVGLKDSSSLKIFCLIPQKQYVGGLDPRVHLLQEYSSKLPLITIALPAVFGPYQQPDNPIPYVMYRAIEGESIPLLDNRVISLPLLYIEDVLMAVNLLEETGQPGTLYFLDSAKPQLSNAEIVDTICETLNEINPPPVGRYQSLINEVEFPVNGREEDLSTIGKENALVLPNTTDLKLAIRKTIEWYLNNPGWYSQSKTRFFDLWNNQDNFELFLEQKAKELQKQS